MAQAKRILVLAATAEHAEPLCVAADKLALEAVLGCSDDSGTLCLDFTTRDSALHIVEFVQQNPVAAIVPVGDQTTPSAARAASMMGLPFHPPRAADACADKKLLRRTLEAVPIPVSPDLHKSTLTLMCIMTSGKLRVLAVEEGPTKPATFPTLPPAIQNPAVELLKKLIAALGLKHGPVRVALSIQPGRLSVSDVSLCYRQTHFTDALRFRLPLVDQDISYAEFIIRNALDLDTSRIHLDLT